MCCKCDRPTNNYHETNLGFGSRQERDYDATENAKVLHYFYFCDTFQLDSFVGLTPDLYEYDAVTVAPGSRRVIEQIVPQLVSGAHMNLFRLVRLSQTFVSENDFKYEGINIIINDPIIFQGFCTA